MLRRVYGLAEVEEHSEVLDRAVQRVCFACACSSDGAGGAVLSEDLGSSVVTWMAYY